MYYSVAAAINSLVTTVASAIFCRNYATCLSCTIPGCEVPRQRNCDGLLLCGKIQISDPVNRDRLKTGKKELFDQNGVYYTVLAGAAYNPCATDFGVNNCTFGQEVSPDIVGVCPVLLYLFDLDFLCLPG